MSSLHIIVAIIDLLTILISFKRAMEIKKVVWRKQFILATCLYALSVIFAFFFKEEKLMLVSLATFVNLALIMAFKTLLDGTDKRQVQ